MTDLLAVLGPAGGVAVLAVMAIVPLLLDLPQRRRAPVPELVVPRQRTAHPERRAVPAGR